MNGPIGFPLPPTQKIDWGPIVGSVAGGIIDAATQERANNATARSAQQQIDFQRDQNATAYQRAVADLRAAGLNPGLAYQQGGAQSGSGSNYQAQPVARGSAEKLIAAMNAYTQFSTATAQQGLIRAQTEQVQAQTATAAPLAALSRTGAYQNLFHDTSIAELRQRIQEATNYPAAFKLTQEQGRQGIATAKAAETESRHRATLMEQDFQNEWFRKNIAPFINSTVKTVTPLEMFKPHWSIRP